MTSFITRKGSPFAQQKELIEEREYKCFLYKDKDGSWKVTFVAPK